MCRILLNDILNFGQSEMEVARIKFNQIYKGKDPLLIWLNNHDEVDNNWLFWKFANGRMNFHQKQIAICFIKMGDDEWLLTTIKNVEKELDLDNEVDGVCCEGKIMKKYEKFFGKIIVKFHKTAAKGCITFKKLQNELEVLQILPSIYDGDEFPGYDKVCLSYDKLKLIIERKKSDWVNALENQKAVYLITDKKTGKLYVGSATSKNGMLLARWQTYVSTFDGGNVKLKELVKEHGEDYVKQNFQYSILENFNSKTDDKYVLQRESWWKEVLDSRKHGYNDN